jgi:hypothetical protein
MNSEIRSLIHKEWRERRTSIAVCSGWLLCCVFYAVAVERSHQVRDPVATFYQASQLYSLFAAVFLAMRTALGEQTLGTLGFSLSLPFSRERLAWTKLAGGGMTLLLPVILGAVVMSPILLSGFVEQAPPRSTMVTHISMPERPSLSAAEGTALLWTVTVVAIAGGVQLFLLLSIFGVRRRSESHIGFFGAVLAFGWLILPELRMTYDAVNGWLGALFPASLIINYGYGGETGSYTELDLGQPVWAPLLVNVLVLMLLAKWFVGRYGTGHLSRQSRRFAPWRRWPAIWSRIPIPLRNPSAALVWINLRQSLPIAISGLLLAAVMTVAQYSQFEHGQGFRSQLPSSTWFVAMLWSAVVGSGVFAAELRPGLSSFWRSRPVSVGAWFWWKFFTGLIAVLVVLDGVTILVSWGTPIGMTSGLSWSYITCMPLIHTTLYAMAVFGVCRFRRPVAGAMFAIVTYGVTLILVQSTIGMTFEPIHIHNLLLMDEIEGQLNLANHNYPLVYGTLFVIVVASAWMASRAIRNPDKRRLLSRRRELAVGS